MNEKMKWSGLYEAKVSDRHPILPKHISRFRRSFKIGDEIWLPVPHGEESFRPNYQSRCRVEEIHRDFIVVSHEGKWREAVNYVDFMTQKPSASVIIASKDLSDEYYRLLDEYWATDSVERRESLDKRLSEIEPLILQSERFSGHRASTKLYGGEIWKSLANETKKEFGTC